MLKNVIIIITKWWDTDEYLLKMKNFIIWPGIFMLNFEK